MGELIAFVVGIMKKRPQPNRDSLEDILVREIRGAFENFRTEASMRDISTAQATFELKAKYFTNYYKNLFDPEMIPRNDLQTELPICLRKLEELLETCAAQFTALGQSIGEQINSRKVNSLLCIPSYLSVYTLRQMTCKFAVSVYAEVEYYSKHPEEYLALASSQPSGKVQGDVCSERTHSSPGGLPAIKRTIRAPGGLAAIRAFLEEHRDATCATAREWHRTISEWNSVSIGSWLSLQSKSGSKMFFGEGNQLVPGLVAKGKENAAKIKFEVHNASGAMTTYDPVINDPVQLRKINKRIQRREYLSVRSRAFVGSFPYFPQYPNGENPRAQSGWRFWMNDEQRIHDGTTVAVEHVQSGKFLLHDDKHNKVCVSKWDPECAEHYRWTVHREYQSAGATNKHMANKDGVIASVDTFLKQMNWNTASATDQSSSQTPVKNLSHILLEGIRGGKDSKPARTRPRSIVPEEVSVYIATPPPNRRKRKAGVTSTPSSNKSKRTRIQIVKVRAPHGDLEDSPDAQINNNDTVVLRCLNTGDAKPGCRYLKLSKKYHSQFTLFSSGKKDERPKRVTYEEVADEDYSRMMWDVTSIDPSRDSTKNYPIHMKNSIALTHHDTTNNVTYCLNANSTLHSNVKGIKVDPEQLQTTGYKWTIHC